MGNVFGVSDYSMQPRMGGSGVETGQWLSDSVMQAKVVAGFNPARSVAVTIKQRQDSASALLTYDTLQLRDFGNATNRVNFPSTGSVPLTLYAQTLPQQDLSPTGRFGGSGMETSQWESTTTLRLRMAQGMRWGWANSTVPVVATMGRQMTVTQLVSMDGPWVRQGEGRGRGERRDCGDESVMLQS
jgi:hypothetical protein